MSSSKPKLIPPPALFLSRFWKVLSESQQQNFIHTIKILSPSTQIISLSPLFLSFFPFLLSSSLIPLLLLHFPCRVRLISCTIFVHDIIAMHTCWRGGGGSITMSGHFSRSLGRVLFIRAFVLGCFLLLVVVDSVSGREMKEKAVMATTKGDTKWREKEGAQPKMDTNYMSKRRVPKGPDPIHNRKAGSSRQPPGKT